MKSLVIVGGNAGSRLAESFARKCGYSTFKYLNTYRDGFNDGELIDLTKFSKLVSSGDYDYFIATGDNRMRKNHYKSLTHLTGVLPVTLIHPGALVETENVIGAGTFIGPGAVINISSTIGIGVIINTLSCVDHDCVLEDFSQVSPGAILTGYCKVGKETFIGSGAVLLPKINVGNKSVVGAGAVVTKDIPSEVVVRGIPAKSAQ